MIITNVIGGLGNQMFQYAFGYAVAQKKGEILKLDITSLNTYALREYELQLFNINAKLASAEEIQNLKYKKENLIAKQFRQLRKKEKGVSAQYYKEAQFNYNKNLTDANHYAYFEGYWQSEQYFKEYREALLKQFTLRKNIHSQSQRYKNEICNTESVSLHIRRGDYVTDAHTNSVHGTCSINYYKESVLKLVNRSNNLHVYIFSDDLNWAKENLNFIKNKTFIELDKEIPDHEEMYLMSLCKHNIIANSSFSWWGAWLNQNKNKSIIAPKQWFNDKARNTSDLIPEDWIRL